MTVEGLKTLFDWGAVILLFLTFAFGAGVLLTGNIINNRQSQQLRQFDKDLTDAKTALGKQQERAAQADERASKIEAGNLQLKTELANAISESRSKQIELEKEQRKTAESQKEATRLQMMLMSFARRVGDRTLEIGKFVESLNGEPKRIIDIRYKPSDDEAERFADDISRALDIAKWEKSVRPMTAEEMAPYQGGRGAGIEFRFPIGQLDHRFVHALMHAMNIGGQSAALDMPEVPNGHIVILVTDKVRL